MNRSQKMLRSFHRLSWAYWSPFRVKLLKKVLTGISISASCRWDKFSRIWMKAKCLSRRYVHRQRGICRLLMRSCCGRRNHSRVQNIIRHTRQHLCENKAAIVRKKLDNSRFKKKGDTAMFQKRLKFRIGVDIKYFLYKNEVKFE